MIFACRCFFQLVGEIINPPLSQERKAPVIFDSFDVYIGFAVGAGVVFVSAVTFEEVFVRFVIDTGRNLPIIRHKFTVYPAEPSPQIFRRLEVSPEVNPSEPVFAPVVD